MKKKKVLVDKIKIFALLSCVFFLSCKSQEIKKVNSDINSLQKICKDTLQSEEFSIITSQKKSIHTKWKTSLSPYQKRGKREKVSIFLHKESPRETGLEIVVVSQVNLNSHDYLDAQQALWVDHGHNRSLEKWLFSLIKNKVLLSSASDTSKNEQKE